MDSSDLQIFIDQNRVKATIIPLNEHTPTVGDAARALGVDTDQIIKSLIFRIDETPVLVINNGLARVDKKKLAAYLGIGRSKVKFAEPEQVLRITGFIVGSMPPFGHKRTLRTLIDASITGLPVVYGGGGDINAMMRMEPDELISVTRAEVIALSE